MTTMLPKKTLKWSRDSDVGKDLKAGFLKTRADISRMHQRSFVEWQAHSDESR